MLSVARAVFHPRFTRRSSGFVAISVLFSLPTSSSYFSAASNDFCRTRSFLSGTMEVEQFPCLDDNYGYIIHDPGTGETAAIDTPEASKYTEGGNEELKGDGVKVYGPRLEAPKIPTLDVGLEGGDDFKFGSIDVEVIDVGGHTKGHIAFYFPSQKKVFVGDSLFALGCGKMFEGTPAQFWASLQRLRALPDDTAVYCAHEYTSSNANFAASVEPGNSELMARVDEITSLRSVGKATVPSLLGLEKRTNPFLRVDTSAEIRHNVGVLEESDTDAEAFGKVRKAKDTFRG